MILSKETNRFDLTLCPAAPRSPDFSHEPEDVRLLQRPQETSKANDAKKPEESFNRTDQLPASCSPEPSSFTQSVSREIQQPTYLDAPRSPDTKPAPNRTDPVPSSTHSLKTRYRDSCPDLVVDPMSDVATAIEIGSSPVRDEAAHSEPKHAGTNTSRRISLPIDPHPPTSSELSELSSSRFNSHDFGDDRSSTSPKSTPTGGDSLISKFMRGELSSNGSDSSRKRKRPSPSFYPPDHNSPTGLQSSASANTVSHPKLTQTVPRPSNETSRQDASYPSPARPDSPTPLTATSLSQGQISFSRAVPPLVPSSQESDDASEGILSDRSSHAGRLKLEDYATPNFLDGCESDSDSSDLPDISELTRAASIRHSATQAKASAPSTRPQYSLQNSLATLANHQKRISATQERIDEYSKSLAETNSSENDSVSSELEDEINPRERQRDLLSGVVKAEDDNEGDHLDKIVQALDRAEVLRGEIEWHFFDSNYSEGELWTPDLSSSLSSEWTDDWGDPEFRQQAFNSGFAEQRAALKNLSETTEDLLWDAAIFEPRGELARAYMSTLTASASAKFCVRHRQIQKTLERLGAKSDALDSTAKVKPTGKPSASLPHRVARRLIWLVRILGDNASYMDFDSSLYAIQMLLRLSLDNEIAKHMELRLRIDSALVAIANSLPGVKADEGLTQVSEQVFKTVGHPMLFRRLLDSIPDTSARLHYLKRRLALAFFMKDAAVLKTALTDSACLTSRIVDLLRKDARFDHTSPTVDYRHLSALIAMLDIGIASGFDPPPSSPTKLSLSQETLYSPFNLRKPPSTIGRLKQPSSLKQPSPKAREETFNAQIDAISVQISSLFARIVDAGAAHMARTEAKGVLERLMYRLDFGVRTRIRPRRDVYDSVLDRMVKVGETQKRRSSGLMEGFLNGRGQKRERDEDASDSADGDWRREKKKRVSFKDPTPEPEEPPGGDGVNEKHPDGAESDMVDDEEALNRVTGNDDSTDEEDNSEPKTSFATYPSGDESFVTAASSPH